MSQDHDEECSTQTQVGKPRRTNSPKFNPDEDGKRRATIMTRVHQVRTRGQRIEVSFDAKGQPLGKPGDELQSWIGVLAREHIPIWISDFRSADLAPRKELSAKGFRYDLYQAFVRDHIDEENVWQRPPKVVHNYPTITQEDWEKFIQYRRSPEFKRLSEQGSEIRKKSKYGSTGGRDGYRKRDQAHFEKTGKYAERYERWLDMRVKPDGQFKKEEFKNIAETIEDITQQETQGSFESVGTEDILTKALGNTEHSGRIRGQSKFVKQSQYFNLVRPPREKDDVEDMKRQIAALQRTVQELCAKHGINGETIPEEMAGPTVDQHNSFKASCTMNEKEAGPSDPNPTPNASKECQLFIPDLVNGGVVLVAIGRAYMDCVPTDTVHGIPLVVQTSLSQASKCPNRASQREAGGSKRTKKRAGRNKLKSQPEVEQQPAQEEPFDFDNISFELRPLAFYAQSSMRDDVECCARTGMDQRFEFISPGLVSPVQQNVDRATYVRERADNILRILRNAPKGKRFLMPYNSGQHWILAVIDPWDDSVMYFNPLGNEPGDDFKDLITTALNGWKVLVGSGMRQRRNWQTLMDTVRCPIQEGYVECGYFVLAYMQEITFTVDGLDVLQTKDFYTDADMSLVRHEWATFFMRFIHY
ncbi:hypothetical protein TIFTF001_040479 [Ficus carica]|uniref:Ubiquitin-like protease family profile domain-containing protein n=1 Tax=Ficus carica TaxID=3494 RepID=A0AA87Z1Z0_FICCA|nr:hypothetical protein TIFTF001_040479 [Ficus carica]